MKLPSQPATAMAVESCDRCGRLFPHGDANDDGRAFCEPCRDAIWREERGLEPRDETLD